MVGLGEIRNLIDHLNVTAPRNVTAEPEDLILVDNRVSKTIKSHYGNLTVVVVEGSWGTGKTSTALKVFHDLKKHAYVTYASAREVMKRARMVPKTKVMGQPSLLATLIATLLVQPQQLLRERELEQYVLTNAPSVNLSIDCELSELLETYSENLIREKRKHVILIDELEVVIKDEADLNAIAVCMITLRRLFDRGHANITIAFLVPPLRTGRAYELVKKARLADAIRDRVRSVLQTSSQVDFETEARYVFNKVLFGNLEEPSILREVYKNFVEKAVQTLNKEYKIQIAITSDVDVAIDLLAQIARYVRFGRDILVDAIAKSVSENKSLKDSIMETLRENFGYKDPIKVLRDGKFGNIEIDINFFSKVVEEYVLKKLKDEGTISSYTKLEERRVRGFESVTYMIICHRGAKKTPEKLAVSFWIRPSDLSDRSVASIKRYFGNKKTVLITTLNAKHGALAFSQADLVDIIRLPNEIMFYLIAPDNIHDQELREGLKEKLIEDHIHRFEEAIRTMVGG